jgi:hypothetical protein
MGTALAAEGRISIRLSTFSADSKALTILAEGGTTKQAAEKLCSLKGTGFSPYINN